MQAQLFGLLDLAQDAQTRTASTVDTAGALADAARPAQRHSALWHLPRPHHGHRRREGDHRGVCHVHHRRPRLSGHGKGGSLQGDRRKEESAMTPDTTTRLDALRALLAAHEPDGYTRALVWSYKQADRQKIGIVREAGK